MVNKKLLFTKALYHTAVKDATPYIIYAKSRRRVPLGGFEKRRIYFFIIDALTICRISSGVCTGLVISFLGQTAAHRPQEVHLS